MQTPKTLYELLEKTNSLKCEDCGHLYDLDQHFPKLLSCKLCLTSHQICSSCVQNTSRECDCKMLFAKTDLLNNNSAIKEIKRLVQIANNPEIYDELIEKLNILIWVYQNASFIMNSQENDLRQFLHNLEPQVGNILAKRGFLLQNEENTSASDLQNLQNLGSRNFLRITEVDAFTKHTNNCGRIDAIKTFLQDTVNNLKRKKDVVDWTNLEVVREKAQSLLAKWQQIYPPDMIEEEVKQNEDDSPDSPFRGNQNEDDQSEDDQTEDEKKKTKPSKRRRPISKSRNPKSKITSSNKKSTTKKAAPNSSRKTQKNRTNGRKRRFDGDDGEYDLAQTPEQNFAQRSDGLGDEIDNMGQRLPAEIREPNDQNDEVIICEPRDPDSLRDQIDNMGQRLPAEIEEEYENQNDEVIICEPRHPFKRLTPFKNIYVIEEHNNNDNGQMSAEENTSSYSAGKGDQAPKIETEHEQNGEIEYYEVINKRPVKINFQIE